MKKGELKGDCRAGVRQSPLFKRILSFVVFLIAMIVIALFRGRMLVVRTYHVPGRSFTICRRTSSGVGQESEGTEQFTDVSNEVHSEVKIVGLADLHGEMAGNNQEQIVEKVREADPDFIVYLGDMVEKTHAEESMETLAILTEQLVQIAPVYYVDGNHEQDVQSKKPDLYRQLNQKLNNLGATQLEDEIVSFTVENCISVNLCGITRHYFWGDEELNLARKLKDMNGVNVLACHYPESVIWYDAFDGGGLDVALCGHTHGGLIRVPFLGGMFAPEQGRWPKYDLGAFPVYTDTTWSEYGGGEDAVYLGTMVISGGLAGEHGVPRVNNPMEVSVVVVE